MSLLPNNSTDLYINDVSQNSGRGRWMITTHYEPAEDSFLLAKIAGTLHGKILEIGCGSGIQLQTIKKAGTGNR